MARFNNTIYLKSESGKNMTFDEFQKQLSRLGMPEEMRFREIRNMLKQESRPVIEQARTYAYQGSQKSKAPRSRTASRKYASTFFYNLYKSIGVWPNKGTVKAYVVIGLRGENKNPAGAYYAKWQLYGLKKALDKNGDVFQGFMGKEFIEDAVHGTGILEKVQIKLQKHMQRRIKALLK